MMTLEQLAFALEAVNLIYGGGPRVAEPPEKTAVVITEQPVKNKTELEQKENNGG